MHIHGTSQIHGAQAINPPHRTTPSPQQPSINTVGGADELDISHEAELVSRVKELPDIRTDLVADIRAQIESGTYETEEKMDIALGRLLDEIG